MRENGSEGGRDRGNNERGNRRKEKVEEWEGVRNGGREIRVGER